MLTEIEYSFQCQCNADDGGVCFCPENAEAALKACEEAFQSSEIRVVLTSKMGTNGLYSREIQWEPEEE
jgi:hypothetical protein